ncbi:MAG TPA: helix-turn-helix transcriptional regulator [Streptosporangiaceae bacterium]|nr:helix-turn-helix transcriptional regulator [Streptosporangiaceae bacterium]
MDEITIGARLRTLRRWRGMTQTELAGLAGLSPSFLSMVETGQRPLDRRSHISAIASALRVSETDLVGGPHLSADPLQSDPHAVIPALRAALQTSSVDDPAVDRARALPVLAREMARIEPLHQACDYAAVGKALPAIVEELHYHVAAPEDEASYKSALETLVDACVCATFTAKDLGYGDLAHLAALQAEEAARRLGDPVQRGKAAFVRAHSLPKTGSWDRTLAQAEHAASDLEPHAGTPLGFQVLGMLELTAALSAAVVQNGERAADWLKEADRVAERVPDAPDESWMAFSATNVGIWRVAVSVERGYSGGAILKLAETVNEDKLVGKQGRRAAFFADVGRGLARESRTQRDAVRWLRRAEDSAPQWIRNSPAVRGTVTYLLDRATTTAGGRELRGMAARMRIQH